MNLGPFVMWEWIAADGKALLETETINKVWLFERPQHKEDYGGFVW